MTKNTFCIRPTVYVPETYFRIVDTTLNIVAITCRIYLNNAALW